MATNTLKTRIRNAYKTESEWNSSNPVLLLGEKAYTNGGSNDGYYKIGDGTSTWSELSYVGSPETKKVIIDTNTYSGIYASANDFANGTFYFGTITPETFYKEWHIKYRIKSSVPSQNNYSGFFEVELWGSQAARTIYKITNAHYSTSYRTLYYHVLYSLTSTGFTNGYGHALGIGLRSSTNSTNSSYPRTFQIDILETDNCSFTFFEAMTKYASIPGTGSTNYNGYSEYDGYNNGLRESGDDNTVTQLLKHGTKLTAGENGIYGYTLVMRDSTLLKFQSIVTSFGNGTSKSKNTSGFYPYEIYFYQPWNNNKVSSGSLTGANVYNAFDITDMRYTLNCGKTLTASKPLYLKGTITNGLFYLSDEMYSQDLPTSEDGYVYIYIGDVCDTYRCNISDHNPIFEYTNGKLHLYNSVTKTDIGLGNVENKSSATIRSELTKDNVTTALGYTPPTTNTTYSAATTSSNGLMTSAMVTKLNGITESADSVSISQSLTSGTKIGTITINGTGTDLYCQTNTDTHYTSHLYVGASGGNANATSTTSDPYLLCVDNTTNRNSIQLKAGSNMSISAVNGIITFNSSYTNTDTKVTQTVTTSNASYPLLLAPSGQTATATTTSYFDSGVTLNPSTNTIAANISGNASTATKVYSTLTNPTTVTTYYIPFHASASSSNKSLLNNNGLQYYTLEGTADATGKAQLGIGNSTASGTAGNKQGSIYLYGTSSGYTYLIPGNNTTSNVTLTLPSSTGTIALTSSNVASATKATQDSAGQQINTTYIKGLSVSGKTITYTKGDGSTGTITTQDTTYSTGTASALGLTKLYTGTGTNTDGTMTQSAITSALNGKAASSHTHTKSQITDMPTSLKNPYALNINGISYDGSSAKDVDLFPLIIGTQTASTGSWTGNASSISALTDGLTIRYWLPYSGSGNATLNLTLADGSTTGAVNCYYSGTSRLTTHYAAGNIITLTYRQGVSMSGSSTTYTGWWADANYDSGNTKNTAGSTDTSSKIFIIGATSQASNPTTYSHDTAYVGTDGCLYSNSTKVSVEGHTHTAGNISAGQFAGAVTANSTATSDVGVSQVRNIYATTTDLTAGTSTLTSGKICLVYE